jgi:hypothetical protein
VAWPRRRAPAASGEIVLLPEIQTALGRAIRSNGRANRPALRPREHDKLGASDRASAVAEAFRRGLLD